MPTVDELLHHAFPSGVELRAGAAGLGRDVSSVVRLRSRASAVEPLRGGELALVPLAALRARDARLTLRRVLEQLAQADVSALAVIGGPDPAAEQAADRLATPLLALPADTHPETLELVLERWLFERRLALQQEGQRLQRELTELALAGAGLPALLERVVRLTGKPSLLQSGDWTPRLQCQPPSGGLPGEVLRSALAASAAAAEEWATGATRPPGDPGVASLEIPEARLVRLLAPVRDGGGVGAYLSLFARPAQLRELDRVVLLAAAGACAIELVREHASLATRDALAGDLIDSLLRGDVANQEGLLRRARRLGHDLSLPHAALAVRPAGRPDDLPRLCAALAALAPDGAPVSRGEADRVLALVPLGSGRPAEAELLERARGWHRDLTAELGSVSLGLGGLHTGLDGLGRALGEAAQALTMGERLFGPGRLVAFGELGLFAFLLRSHDPTQLMAFHASALGPLLAYDRAHAAELVPTLEAYFASRCSPQATAARLHLHRNSLLYRLKRIEAIAGVDLDNPETGLLLHLALRVGQVIPLARDPAR